MKRLQSNWLVVLGLAAAAISTGAIIQAVIPQVVPTANKIGNSTKFQLGAAGAVAGDCAQFDASLNVTGPGTAAGCGGAASNSGGLTVYSGTAGISLSGTTFFPIGGGSGASTTEAAVEANVQATITWSNFGVSISSALGMGNSGVFTWRDAGASQTLTCTISGAVATTCQDATHSFANAPGDLMDVQAIFAGSIIVAPTFNMTVQTGALLAGSVNAGTQFQIGEYLTAGSAISGVSIPDCVDTGGNHVNFTAATGVFNCGTTSSGGGSGNPYVFPASPTAIVTGNWTNFNMASCSETGPQTGFRLLSSNAAAGNNICGRTIAFPAGAFTRTFAINPRFLTPGTNGANVGVGFTNGTAISNCGLQMNAVSAIGVELPFGAKYTNSTTFSASYTLTNTPILDPNALAFLQLFDDGAGNLGCRWSPDGVSFQQLWTDKDTTGAGGFLTPTTLLYDVNAGGSSIVAAMVISSFTNP